MKKHIFNNNPLDILAFLIKATSEKIVYKNKQRKIEYVSNVSTSVNDTIFDNAIALAHHRLDETEKMISSVFESLNKIDEMEIEELIHLLDRILLALNGWDLKDEEFIKIRNEIHNMIFDV